MAEVNSNPLFQSTSENLLNYRVLFEAAGDAIFILRKGRFIECNPAALELYGCSPEELIGKTPLDFSLAVQPDGHSSAEKVHQMIAAATEGSPQVFEWQHARLDGSIFTVQVNLSRVGQENGPNLLAIVRDITEHKQAHEILIRQTRQLEIMREIDRSILKAQSSESISQAAIESLEQIIPGALFGVVHYDIPAGHFTVLAASSSSPPELRTRVPFAIEVIQDAIDQLQCGCSHANIDMQYLGWIGKLFIESDIPMPMIFFPLSFQGNLIGSLCVAAQNPQMIGQHKGLLQSVADQIAVAVQQTLQTEARQKAEQVLQEQQRLAELGTLAAGIAHEINSPLQVITGISERIQSAIPADDPDYTRVEMINQSGWRIADIVKSLLTYARPTADLVELHDLNLVIQKSLLLMEHQLKTWSNITINKTFCEDCPPIYCNQNSITQMMVNLLTNSMDAMPDGGEIEITTQYKPENRRLLLKVSDTGTGIPEKLLTRVFFPFFTTKPVGKGTGLGLSIVQSLIRAHNGEVDVQSSPAGTSFIISLPIDQDLQTIKNNLGQPLFA